MSGEARRTIRGSSGWPSISPRTLLAPAAYQARREIEKASGPRIVTITGGLVIEVTAETRTFEPDPQRQRRYRQFLDRHIPRFAGPELYTKTCLYTIPSDQNFVLDTLPADPRVVVAVGAGHAYEFAALIGIILADLACEGTSSPPVEGFSLARLATTDPAFGKEFHT